jgi:hypothetical protein
MPVPKNFNRACFTYSDPLEVVRLDTSNCGLPSILSNLAVLDAENCSTRIQKGVSLVCKTILDNLREDYDLELLSGTGGLLVHLLVHLIREREAAPD